MPSSAGHRTRLVPHRAPAGSPPTRTAVPAHLQPSPPPARRGARNASVRHRRRSTRRRCPRPDVRPASPRSAAPRDQAPAATARTAASTPADSGGESDCSAAALRCRAAPPRSGRARSFRRTRRNLFRRASRLSVGRPRGRLVHHPHRQPIPRNVWRRVLEVQVLRQDFVLAATARP